jgi:tRNA A37 threonylcarbamoyladenosine synthetase subunit TsaC/SUA5/YrdC
MLEETAYVDKFTYDFLKRVWPGEVIAQLKSKACAYESNIFMRMPRHKYMHDIINGVGEPLLYVPDRISEGKMFFNDRDIVRRFKNICSMLIIDEFNKNHTFPTLIDISCDRLDILCEGRVSSDEIKSLYFLGDL